MKKLEAAHEQANAQKEIEISRIKAELDERMKKLEAAHEQAMKELENEKERIISERNDAKAQADQAMKQLENEKERIINERQINFLQIQPINNNANQAPLLLGEANNVNDGAFSISILNPKTKSENINFLQNRVLPNSVNQPVITIVFNNISLKYLK